MRTNNMVKAFAAILMGGAGNIWGALLGGLFIGIAENMGMAFIPSDYKDFIAFGMIILLLLFKPRGLFSIAGKFSISPGIQDILLNSTRRLKGKQTLSPRVIEILRL